MKLDLEIKNFDAIASALAQLSGQQARKAYAKAINDAGFLVRRGMQAELGKFDRVTPFILKSPKLIAATADKLSATILPTIDGRNLPSRGGKIGVDPQDVLQAQEYGGPRRDKRSESVLRRAGILPAGYQTAIPAIPFPGSDDGRGNLRGAFLQQLLSYLQAFGEQGYKANATAKRIKAIQKGTAKTAGRRYFVSYGRLRGQHLAAGVWAAQGLHSVDIRPVLMFVKAGTYSPLISMERIAKDADVQVYLDKRVRFRVRELAESL